MLHHHVWEVLGSSSLRSMSLSFKIKKSNLCHAFRLVQGCMKCPPWLHWCYCWFWVWWMPQAAIELLHLFLFVAAHAVGREASFRKLRNRWLGDSSSSSTCARAVHVLLSPAA